VRNPLALSILALVGATLVACGTGRSATTTSAAAAATPHPQSTPLVVGGATLPAGPELDALENSCRACHSLGMVTQQRLSKMTWKAEVEKMRKFGAPLPAAKEAAVVDYLAAHLRPGVPLVAPHAVVTAPPITYTSATK
jgi:cytochrome c5